MLSKRKEWRLIIDEGGVRRQELSHSRTIADDLASQFCSLKGG